MKNKLLFYIKYSSYVIAFLGFLSLMLNPRTLYLNANFEIVRDYGRLFLFLGVVSSLFIITISSFFYDIKKYELKKSFTISSLVYLLLMIYIINTFFYIFWFDETNDFVIFALYILPIVFILNDLLQPKWINPKILIPIGLLLIASVISYFKYFYAAYEDYWNGISIVIIHYIIRDWLCLIGSILILVSLLRIKNHER